MFLKLYGRYEGQIDNRDYLCRKWFVRINIKQNTMIREFRNEGVIYFYE